MITAAEISKSIQHLFRVCLTRALEDWEMQIGYRLQAGDASARLIGAPSELGVLWTEAPVVQVSTQIERGVSGSIRLLFPVDAVWPIVGAALCIPGDARDPRTPMDEEQLEAFGELMNLLCGSFNQIYDTFGLRVSQSVEHLHVEQFESGLSTDLRGLAIAIPIHGDDPEDALEAVQVVPFPVSRAVAIHMRNRLAA